MQPLPQSLFDVFALALPRGHGFGKRPPCEAWMSEDGRGCAIITRHVTSSDIGLIVMRRREDDVWSVTVDRQDLPDAESARAIAAKALQPGLKAEPLPPGAFRRPPLYELRGRSPSKLFKLLGASTHHVAAWLLNQLYLSLPSPDRNWAADCQTGNFHTRMWEAQLLASFREQGLLVTQPYESPDFRIENRRGGAAWIEAVTANPAERFEHVGAEPVSKPLDLREHLLGPAAVRFANTIHSKLGRRYDQLKHVAGSPFAIALADFHAASSMLWSREALISYLYGIIARAEKVKGQAVAVSSPVTHLLGEQSIPAGLFRNGDRSELAAVMFSNACTIGKFNRVGVSAGMATKGLRYVRFGEFFDREPGALVGVPFCMDVRGAEYRSLWPQGYEPWSAELEVFHNPFARHPLPPELLPEATHWRDVGGEIRCHAHYRVSILKSQTLILDEHAQVPTVEQLLGKRNDATHPGRGSDDVA